MALTKIGKEGITGISNSADATFLTVDSSEQAVIKSEGGAVTTSVQKGLAKFLVNYDAINQTTDIFQNDKTTIVVVCSKHDFDYMTKNNKDEEIIVLKANPLCQLISKK